MSDEELGVPRTWAVKPAMPQQSVFHSGLSLGGLESCGGNGTVDAEGCPFSPQPPAPGEIRYGGALASTRTMDRDIRANQTHAGYGPWRDGR